MFTCKMSIYQRWRSIHRCTNWSKVYHSLWCSRCVTVHLSNIEWVRRGKLFRHGCDYVKEFWQFASQFSPKFGNRTLQATKLHISPFNWFMRDRKLLHFNLKYITNNFSIRRQSASKYCVYFIHLPFIENIVHGIGRIQTNKFAQIEEQMCIVTPPKTCKWLKDHLKI